MQPAALSLPHKITGMKKIVPLAFIMMALSFTNFVHAQDKAQWKEMDEFHTVMATTFHPAEEGNLQPIRTRSQEMVNKATAWKNSAVPAGYDATATAAALKKLVKGTREIDKMVKAKATDQALVAKLTELHDVFHEIMEKCRKEDHH
jgi:hypothetical protein